MGMQRVGEGEGFIQKLVTWKLSWKMEVRIKKEVEKMLVR